MAAILADEIFKWIFLNENERIPIQISLKFVPNSPIDNNLALVHVQGKPKNIAPKFVMYNLGDSFHEFITQYESILTRNDLMDEAALRLPECLSALMYSMLFPQIRSDFDQTIDVLKKTWCAPSDISGHMDFKGGTSILVINQRNDYVAISLIPNFVPQRLIQ